MNEMPSKRCSRGEQCAHPNGPILPLSEYSKRSDRPIGVQSRCKVCQQQMDKEHYWSSQERRDRNKTDAARSRHNVRDRDRRAADPEYAERCRERARAYRDKHPEAAHRAASRSRERYSTDPEYRQRNLEQQRQRLRQNPDRRINLLKRNRERKDRWNEQRREANKEYNRRYQSDPEYRTRQNAERRQRMISDPEYRSRKLAANRRRRARKSGARGSHTGADILRQYETQRGRCYYCGVELASVKPHVDHVIPLDQGGSDSPENLVIACRFCNLSKHNRTPEQWGWYQSCPT